MKLGWNLKTFGIDTLYFAAGSILYALGLHTFALHAGFAPGGVAGLSIIVNHYTGWPIGITGILFNIPLALLAVRTIGLPFIVKSLWTMVVNALFLDIIFPLLPAYQGSPLLAAMFTGVSLGAGLAIIYMRGSSTGGADFVIMTIKKKRPQFSVGQISLVLDAVVILFGGVVFGNVDAVLYGIISSFAANMTVDQVMYGAGSSKLALIITNKGRRLADAISAETGRGSTLLEATGTYTGSRREVLLCACSKNEIYKVRVLARVEDPDSLVMITEASEVVGEGFVPPPLPGNEATPK